MVSFFFVLSFWYIPEKSIIIAILFRVLLAVGCWGSVCGMWLASNRQSLHCLPASPYLLHISHSTIIPPLLAALISHLPGHVYYSIITETTNPSISNVRT